MTRQGGYRLDLKPRARRQLADELPEAVATAALEFILGPLLDNPRRVGKPLIGRYEGQHSSRRGPEWRIRYQIDDTRRPSQSSTSPIARTPTVHDVGVAVG